MLVSNLRATAKMNPVKEVPSEDFNVFTAMKSIALGKQNEQAATVAPASLGYILATVAPAPAFLEATSKAYQ